MRKTAKILIWIIVIAGIVTLAEFFYFKKNDNSVPITPQNKTQQTAMDIPGNANQQNDQTTAQPEIAENAESDNLPLEENSNTLPSKFLLDMPFNSQAPLSKWDAFHEDMCEEASVLNAVLYLEGKKLTNKQFETELQKMQKAEKKEIGEWKSTTIAQTKQFVDQYFEEKIHSKTIDNPTTSDIEKEVAAGNPVVVPLSGRDIGNPNFTPPGPVYHMLVIKGYDANNFITNDVGTRKGNSYVYPKSVIMKNTHDWNAKDIHLGAKRVLVFYK